MSMRVLRVVHFPVTQALLCCVQEGAEVVLADINGPAAEEAAAEVQQVTFSKCTGGPRDCCTSACPGSLLLPAAQPPHSWSSTSGGEPVCRLPAVQGLVTAVSEDRCLGSQVSL